MADKSVLVMNGPNLNLLGMREPGVYGDESYDAICARVEEQARALGLQADFFQSNSEGALIDRLHAAMGVRRHRAERRRLHPLQLCHPGCHRGHSAAGGGGASVQYPRPGGVPAYIGHCAGLPGADRGLRAGKLYAGAPRAAGAAVEAA